MSPRFDKVSPFVISGFSAWSMDKFGRRENLSKYGGANLGKPAAVLFFRFSRKKVSTRIHWRGARAPSAFFAGWDSFLVIFAYFLQCVIII